MRPKSINILGKEYSITYFTNTIDVDSYHRNARWGEVDYWARAIRIFHGDNGDMQDADVLQNILHETLHAVAQDLKLDLNKDENHDELDLISLALSDILLRNEWLKKEL
jgi:hypothetical protein